MPAMSVKVAIVCSSRSRTGVRAGARRRPPRAPRGELGPRPFLGAHAALAAPSPGTSWADRRVRSTTSACTARTSPSSARRAARRIAPLPAASIAGDAGQECAEPQRVAREPTTRARPRSPRRCPARRRGRGRSGVLEAVALGAPDVLLDQPPRVGGRRPAGVGSAAKAATPARGPSRRGPPSSRSGRRRPAPRPCRSGGGAHAPPDLGALDDRAVRSSNATNA